MNFQNISSHGHKSLAASLKKKKSQTLSINKQTNQRNNDWGENTKSWLCTLKIYYV